MKLSPGNQLPRSLRVLLIPLAASIASPAIAHHPTGPTGSSNSGASFVVLGPGTLQKGDAWVGSWLMYNDPDSRSDEELSELAGNHIHAHDYDYMLHGAIGFAYGVTDRLTISADLPYVRRDGLRAGHHSHHGGHAMNTVMDIGSVSGIGDANILAKYQLLNSDQASIALLGGVKLPTGSTHKHGNDGERLDTEHQPGSGSWDGMLGAAFGTKFGSFNINASVLYHVSGKGAQATRLGDRAQAGIALSRHFGPSEHHHNEGAGHGGDHSDGTDHHMGAPHGHSSWDAFVELTGEWEGHQRVDGVADEHSGSKTIWLSPGARYNTANGFSIGGSVGVPVWQDIGESHPDNDYRLIVSVGRAF